MSNKIKFDPCPACLGSGCIQITHPGSTEIQITQCTTCCGFGTIYIQHVDENNE